MTQATESRTIAALEYQIIALTKRLQQQRSQLANLNACYIRATKRLALFEGQPAESAPEENPDERIEILERTVRDQRTEMLRLRITLREFGLSWIYKRAQQRERDKILGGNNDAQLAGRHRR